eukprot:8465803-Ditylum_brightwellii.AAC.1
MLKVCIYLIKEDIEEENTGSVHEKGSKGMKGKESKLDDISEKLEQYMSRNFIGVVDNFEMESDLYFITGFAQ